MRRSLAEKARARLAKRQRPQSPPIELAWTPNPGPQEQFFRSTCQEILYGGAAGGGKSDALIAFGLKYSHLPNCNAILFRRDATQFDDLIAKSTTLYPKVYPGLTPVYSPHFRWKFPSGAVLNFRHMQHEKDAAKYDGWEINLLLFDELTHFLEKQYLALCARVRSADPGLPTLIRATTNPGGIGHEWVFRRWGAWLDPEFKAPGLPERRDENGSLVPPAPPGEVWWVRTDDDGSEHFFREKPETKRGETPALSRTFIPANIWDNPHLFKNDPNYEGRLNSLDPVRREQLKNGDWLAKAAAGRYFKRGWVEFVDAAPADVLRRFRAWDLAGTEKKDAKGDPDWTVGALVSIARSGLVYVEDIQRIQGTPGDVKQLLRSTAELDGVQTSIFIPQDPGQAGKYQVADLRKALIGFVVKTTPVSGDKITRFAPFSSYAAAATDGEFGNIRIVRGSWNKAFIEELESFPEGTHDDQCDAVADGFRMVSGVNKMVLAMARGK